MPTPLPAPGSTGYLQALITNITEETGSLFPPQIFTSIYLCLVAGHEKHLILEARDEDVADVKSLVVRILVCIFGLPTQRIKVRKEDTAEDLLNNIFLVPPPVRAPSASQTYSSGKARRSRSRSKGRVRVPPLGSSISNSSFSASQTSAGGSTPLYQSLTFPERTGSIHSTLDGALMAGHSRQQSTTSTITTALTIKRRSMSALLPDDASTKALRPQSTHGFHIETNPPTPSTPMSPLPPLQSPGEYPPAQMPSYMSSATMAPRLPHALVLSKMEKCKPSVQNALTEVLRTKRIQLDHDISDWNAVESLESSQANRNRRGSGTSGNSWNLPSGFIVVCIVPQGDGQDRPPLHRSLLDRFSFCAPITMEQNLYNAAPGPFRRTSLISQEHLEHLREISNNTHLSPMMDTYLSSLLSAARHHPSLDGTLLSARCVADYSDLVKASQAVFGRKPHAWSQSTDTGTSTPTFHLGRGTDVSTPRLSVTEVDARRMLPFVLQHRLRVRDRPGEGILGCLHRTAVDDGFSSDDAVNEVDEDDDKLTVRSILEEILEEV